MKLISAFLRSNSFFNVSNEHVSMFIVEKGEVIEKGDFVVVNTRTLLARKPVEKSGYFTVGVAAKIIDQADGNQAVICVDGCHMLYDTSKNISESDIGRACYFLGKNSVTMHNINKTKAGIIEGIEVSDDPIDIEDGTDRIVWVKNNLTEGSDLEW